MSSQRGPIADKPKVPKRIHESTLSMCAPRRLVIANDVALLASAFAERVVDYGIWVITEQLDAQGCRTDGLWSGPTVPFRFAQEERGAADLQPRNRSEIPEYSGTKRALIPFDRRLRVRHREHHRHHGSLGMRCHSSILLIVCAPRARSASPPMRFSKCGWNCGRTF
jgi:hypothetical protein